MKNICLLRGLKRVGWRLEKGWGVNLVYCCEVPKALQDLEATDRCSRGLSSKEVQTRSRAFTSCPAFAAVTGSAAVMSPCTRDDAVVKGELRQLRALPAWERV